ncbi:CGNR zinc finger domain-containing protein [Streptomyces sp. NPDC059092]|uniref:CGNR zinc finger domain-containing protein n=1 Tax=Streptomyces sp. NPDC059092 TaxID=3346725 RepID=UPI003676719A
MEPSLPPAPAPDPDFDPDPGLARDPGHRPADRSARLSVRSAAHRTVALVNALTLYGSHATGEDDGKADSKADSEGPAPLPAPDTVAGVLLAHGEPGPVQLSADDIAEMRTAALLLREVFAAPDVDTAAAGLNRLLRRSTGTVRLTSHNGLTDWHPHLDSDDEAPWGEWLLASSCLALTVLIWDHQRPPGGLCASPSCRNVFLTQGGGPARRYCSRRCATRERVAAHRRDAHRRAARPA